ncbi:MAG TPA: hypothetical protein V6C58_22715 [Allocoleopsis sp.]
MVEISKYLESVADDKALKIADGRLIHSLEELYSIMNDSGPEIFYTHVNDVNNDVATWTRNSLSYNEFADVLNSITDRDEFLKILSEKISELKNPKIASTLEMMKPLESTKTQESNPVNISAPFVSPDAQNSNIAPSVASNVVISSTPVSSNSVSSNSVVSNPVQSVPIQTTSVPATPVVSAVQSNPVQSAPSVSTTPPVNQTSSNMQAPDPKIESASALASFMSDERFDFEDIFNILLYELEQEVLVSE